MNHYPLYTNTTIKLYKNLVLYTINAIDKPSLQGLLDLEYVELRIDGKVHCLVALCNTPYPYHHDT